MIYLGIVEKTHGSPSKEGTMEDIAIVGSRGRPRKLSQAAKVNLDLRGS